MWRWYWTPGGWLRAIIAVSLLVGGAFTEGVISTVMIVAGLVILVVSYLATAANIKKQTEEGWYAKLLSKNGDKVVGPFQTKEELMEWYDSVEDWGRIEKVEVVVK